MKSISAAMMVLRPMAMGKYQRKPVVEVSPLRKVRKPSLSIFISAAMPAKKSEAGSGAFGPIRVRRRCVIGLKALRNGSSSPKVPIVNP
jgi:hypothetical protein